MKTVIIGASGHYHQAVDAARSGLCAFPCAVAPGSGNEDTRPLAEKLGIKEYSSYPDMLDEEKPEVAVVNPWFCLNAKISAECLRRGIHVFSEKPLATELNDLKTLESVWRESGKALGCMLNLNCCAWFKTLENAVKNGEIGEVRTLHGQKSYRMGTRGAVYQKRADYGGMIPWVGVHAVDWVLRLGGKCEWVSAAQTTNANRGNGEMESAAAALLGLENGVIGTVTADFLRPTASARHDDDRLRVTGTRGMIEAVDGKVYLENDRPRRELPLLPDENPFARFLRTIGTEEGKALSLEALNDTRVCLLTRRAGDEGRVIRTDEICI